MEQALAGLVADLEAAQTRSLLDVAVEEDWGEGRGLLQTDDERQGAVDAEDGSGRASLSLDALLDEIGLGRWNVGIVLICGLGNAADAVEAMCMGYILPELERQIVSILCCVGCKRCRFRNLALQSVHDIFCACCNLFSGIVC